MEKEYIVYDSRNTAQGKSHVLEIVSNTDSFWNFCKQTRIDVEVVFIGNRDGQLNL